MQGPRVRKSKYQRRAKARSLLLVTMRAVILLLLRYSWEDGIAVDSQRFLWILISFLPSSLYQCLYLESLVVGCSGRTGNLKHMVRESDEAQVDRVSSSGRRGGSGQIATRRDSETASKA